MGRIGDLESGKIAPMHALTTVLCLTSFLGSVGQVAEWLKAPVSKTGIPFTRYREFESLPVRFQPTPWVARRACFGEAFGVFALLPGS